MNKKFTLLLILSFAFIYAQPPIIGWQKCMGGTGGDLAESIQLTPDGGYIMSGYSSSSDGDATANHGGSDYWIVKFNATGTIAWQKSLGGTASDISKSILLTSDGGYIVCGQTYSNDGDVSGNHNFWDYWVIKLSATGTVEWKKTYGGPGSDFAYSIENTADGGYIMAGSCESNGGDVTGNHGQSDFWIVKVNASGSIQWQKSLGGTNNESASDIQATPDGGYIVAGYSFSINGDVTGNHGNVDSWIVKLSSSGILQWQKSMGGTGWDYADSIRNTNDGGYIVTGRTASTDGDITANHGGNDYWVMKLNATGNIQWQKTYGGSGEDIGHQIDHTADGGYVITGYSNSADGDVTGNHGDYDYWIIKLDATGNLQWQKSVGGAGLDRANALAIDSNGDYMVAGRTSSNDGDVSGNHGGTGDCWVVKLVPDGLATAAFEKESITIYPIPAGDRLQLQTPANTTITKIKITNMSGQVVLEENQNSTSINVENLVKGMYILEASSVTDRYVYKFAKE